MQNKSFVTERDQCSGELKSDNKVRCLVSGTICTPSLPCMEILIETVQVIFEGFCPVASLNAYETWKHNEIDMASHMMIPDSSAI